MSAGGRKIVFVLIKINPRYFVWGWGCPRLKLPSSHSGLAFFTCHRITNECGWKKDHAVILGDMNYVKWLSCSDGSRAKTVIAVNDYGVVATKGVVQFKNPSWFFGFWDTIFYLGISRSPSWLILLRLRVSYVGYQIIACPWRLLLPSVLLLMYSAKI